MSNTDKQKNAALRGRITSMNNSDKGTATKEQLATIAKLDPDMPLAGLTRQHAADIIQLLLRK